MRCSTNLPTWAALIVAFSVFSPGAALASDDQSEALQLFEQSADRYREGKFDEAAELLERAYALHPEPVLLYNLGRAYEGLGFAEKAIDAYKRYLESSPEAKDRGALERRIETLQKQVDERERLAEEQRRLERERQREKPVEPTPDRAAGAGAGPWPWVVSGVGVAALGAGAVFGLQANGKRSDAESEPGQRRAAETFRNAETAASTANVFFIAGGLITAAGVTWIILDRRAAQREQARLELRVTPGGLVLGGRL